MRLLVGSATDLGPGKTQLLEAIAETGSISAAARKMNMSYRRAWNLVDKINRDFEQPLVLTNSGGKGGGGAEVTAFGHEVLRRYRQIEEKALRSVAADLDDFTRFLSGKSD